MTKIILTLTILFFVGKVFSQSISIKEIETFVKEPIEKSEQNLLDKSFELTQINLNGKDTIKTFQKAFESIKLGRIWYKKNGTKLRDVTYTTSDKVAMVYLLSEIKDAGFKYTSDTYDNDLKGKYIFLESSEYSAQIFISEIGGDNLIKLVEK